MLVLSADRPAEARADVPTGPPSAECCRHEDLASEYGIIWTGADPKMTIERLAAYAAPVLWFSPDEPLLKEGPLRRTGKDINLPVPFPFEEESEQPIVYFRVRRILQRVDEAGPGKYTADIALRGHSVIYLEKVGGIDLDFFFYYPMDVGGNPHKHDVEYIETRLAVGRAEDCAECPFVMGLMRVNAKAHGVLCFDNTLETDDYTVFPVTLLVEEGKHASCTDKNGDGLLQYSADKDVNERVKIDNDIMVLANPEIARLPNWVVALVAAGGLAAALSTAAGLLLVISSAVSHDLIKKQLKPDISDHWELILARVAAGATDATLSVTPKNEWDIAAGVLLGLGGLFGGVTRKIR